MIAIAVAVLMAQSPDAGLIRDDRACYVISMTRAGETRPVGVTWQTIERGRDGDREVLRVVVHQRLGDGAFDMRDAFVLDARDLRPIRFENVRNGHTHVVLDYAADGVSGEKREPDGAVEPLEARFDRPTWEGNLFGLTFAALPLADGTEFTVPYYQYDRGPGEFTVRVTGTEVVPTPDGPVEAWVLDAGADPGRRMTYLIAQDGRRELGYRAAQGSQSLGGDCSGLQ